MAALRRRGGARQRPVGRPPWARPTCIDCTEAAGLPIAHLRGDGASAMAMGHVILTEFFRDRQVDDFTDYVKRYTDLPFLVTLRERGEAYVPDRFLTAADLGGAPAGTEGAAHKTVLLDAATGQPRVPNGSLGFRYTAEGEGRWNLDPDGQDYRLLAIAKYDDRYVVPPAHAEDAGRLMSQHEQMFCSLDTEGGPGMGGGPPGSEQSFHPGGEAGGSHTVTGADGRRHFNLLGWDGRGSAPYLFPDRGTP